MVEYMIECGMDEEEAYGKWKTDLKHAEDYSVSTIHWPAHPQLVCHGYVDQRRRL
jgi:hypothetical protein